MNRKIEETGLRISDIVKKMQTLRSDETKDYSGNAAIINFDQKIKALIVDNSDKDVELFTNIAAEHPNMVLCRERDISSAVERLGKETFDIIFSECRFPDGTGLDLLATINEKKN